MFRFNFFLGALMAAAMCLFTGFTATATPLAFNGTLIGQRGLLLADGPQYGVHYAQLHASENDRISAQRGTGRDDDIRITTVNNAPYPIWIWVEHVAFDTVTKVLLPSRPYETMVKLLPGESMETGHFQTINYSGAIRAYRGCDDAGNNCVDELNAATKFEYAGNPALHALNMGIDISLVDGLTTRGHFAYGEGSTCQSFQCQPSDDQVYGTCPGDRIRTDRGYVRCTSDCKVTGSWDDCFSETHQSSMYLYALCPEAYAWSADHNRHYDDCNPKGDLLVHITG